MLFSIPTAEEIHSTVKGQVINFDKSSIHFNNNLSENTCDTYKQILKVRSIEKSDKYLGTTLLLGRSKVDVVKNIHDNFDHRLKGWNGIVRGVRGIHLYGALDPENGECKALREAAICAYEMQDTKVLFKSYCFNLASSIYQRCFSWCSPVELENCK
ncbi:uncharacterized protein LOC113342518 isoform X2 [Papaver somniferum]|uniref:uncharacterized protein LOC113342518 isoform X2 n=1 Tax=Papaver somniferum TaxID=3469 RepID=UPI000E704332|nr:uncharacterized protein LOC113342518 isoform X2 [Papaver somniferum]